MKLLITSDIHGDIESLTKIINKHKDIKTVICAGDIGLDIKTIEENFLIAVKGNGDFYLDLPLKRIVDIDGKKILITHGHLENVKYGLSAIKKLALDNRVDICIFGHTHEPYFEEYENIMFINPGAVNGIYHDYAIYDDGDVSFYGL